MNRITRQFAAWVACLAILFGALAPAISHALTTARGEAWAEVCGVDGPKLVKLSADQGGLSAPLTTKLAHTEHCPYCATHGGAPALPPGVRPLIAQVDARDAQPMLFLQSPHPLPIWSAAQSRAPPASV